jgi:hypothetical protein
MIYDSILEFPDEVWALPLALGDGVSITVKSPCSSSPCNRRVEYKDYFSSHVL